MTTAANRRPPVLGPEPWSEIAGCAWSHWDLWYSIVAIVDYGGSFDDLERRLVADLRGHLEGRHGTESLLSHLADLRGRLVEAGLDPTDLANAESLADKTLVAKARKKLSGRSLEGRAMTPAMIETPRVRLTRRVRTGGWPSFPVDPAVYFRSFRRHVEVKDHITKNRSFGVVERVEGRLRALDRPSLGVADRLALYRAFHTAGLELIERADDSYGNVGQMREEAWRTYLGLDWQAAGMRPEDYWVDICGLVVFEDYGLGFKDETRPWAHVPSGHALMVERFLNDLERECRASSLDHQADEALQQLAWMAVAGRRFNLYAGVAARLGSEHWMPIVAFAESALRSDRRDLAVEVFGAADRPGLQQKFLRERCVAMTGVDLAGEKEPLRGSMRRLRLVDELQAEHGRETSR